MVMLPLGAVTSKTVAVSPLPPPWVMEMLLRTSLSFARGGIAVPTARMMETRPRPTRPSTVAVSPFASPWVMETLPPTVVAES